MSLQRWPKSAHGSDDSFPHCLSSNSVLFMLLQLAFLLLPLLLPDWVWCVWLNHCHVSYQQGLPYTALSFLLPVFMLSMLKHRKAAKRVGLALRNYMKYDKRPINKRRDIVISKTFNKMNKENLQIMSDLMIPPWHNINWSLKSARGYVAPNCLIFYIC